MSWSEKRRRSVQKLITFSPDEWKRVDALHKRVSRYTTRYRSFTAFARKLLTDGEIRVIEIKPLTDPEPLAREISRIGVNVNQIARIANLTGSVSPQQMRELHDLLALIDERMTGMEREKAEIDAVQGLY